MTQLTLHPVKRAATGRRQIVATSQAELKPVLAQLGFMMTWIADLRDTPKLKRPTFARWSKGGHLVAGRTYLLAFGGHWGLVQGRRYACGITGKPVPLSQVPHRRARVKSVLLIERAKQVDAAAVVAALPKVAANRTFLSQTADRLAVKRLAEPHQIEVDDSQRDKDDPDATIWVYPGPQWPEGLADPYDDEHYHDDWASARKAVETYAAAIAARERPFGVGEPVTFVVN